MDGEVARGGRVLPTLLAALVLLLVATSVVLWLDRREADAGSEPLRPADIGEPGWRRGAAGAVVVLAERAALAFFTLDHRSPRADAAAVRTLGTPGFVAAYDRQLRSLLPRLLDERISLTAALPGHASATERLDDDRATVLVSVDVTSRRAGTSSAPVAHRTRVVLERTGEGWRVAGLDEVGGAR